MKTGIFEEDGWKAEVEILEDSSNDEKLAYKLKVLKTIEKSPMYTSIPDGEIFDVWIQRDCYFGGMWTLEIL